MFGLITVVFCPKDGVIRLLKEFDVLKPLGLLGLLSILRNN